MSWLIADLTNIPTPKNDNFESILSKILAWSYSQHKITKQDWHENNRKQCINDPIYVRNCTYIFTICKISIQKLLDTLKFLSTCMNVHIFCHDYIPLSFENICLKQIKIFTSCYSNVISITFWMNLDGFVLDD